MAAAGPILIAGGGIGGLALALALAKAGRNAVILEQHEQFATAGAGIQLGPNGVQVLRAPGARGGAPPAGRRARSHLRSRRSLRPPADISAARAMDRGTARRTLLGLPTAAICTAHCSPQPRPSRASPSAPASNSPPLPKRATP